MKKQLCNDQITRIIERENVITFKRKNEPKSSLKSQKDEEEEEVKSNPNQDSSFQKQTKRNLPLPEINRERKRLALRASDVKPSTIAVYGQKEVRQRDNLMLKNTNNNLANQNLKLKTKNTNLQKEIARLQKIIEEDPQKSWGAARQGRHTQSNSLKIAMRNLKKELEESKKQNGKIKASIKFTTISELEVERDAILQETQRLREMLEQERNRCNYLKMAQQNVSQQEFKQLQDRNFALSRENSDLKSRLSKNGQEKSGSRHHQDIERNISRQLLNARNTIKQKDKELDYLKNQIKKLSLHQDPSLRVIETPVLQNSRSRQIKSQNIKPQPRTSAKAAKQKRLMSKSAQKYRTQVANAEKNEECQNCKRLKTTNSQLQKTIEELKAEIDKLKSSGRQVAQDFSKNPFKVPTQAQISQLRKFLIHRFKAHHLTLEEAVMHLLNIQDPRHLQIDVTIAQLLQISMTQPFSILSDRYIETFICQMCYYGSKGQTITIEESKTLKKKQLRQNFIRLIGQYDLIPQAKEDEMFIQIAQLITNYQQHIHKALNQRRNTENTVTERDFYEFFKEIELEAEHIDFMVSQIVLQSLDLDHLNIYNLFEIFYMPQEEEMSSQGLQGSGTKSIGKGKYKMIETIVKEVDEEYEESKSFLDGKQKSKHQQQQRHLVPADYEEEYEQQFEQEKKQSNIEEEEAEKGKRHVEKKKEVVSEHFEIENAENEYIQDYET